jgi:hypothetical protein
MPGSVASGTPYSNNMRKKLKSNLLSNKKKEKNILIYISKKIQRYTLNLYLETALHVSGVTSTHHQEHIQLYLQHLVFVTPLLLSAAIAAGSSNGVTNTRCCRYSCVCFL